MKAHIPIYLCIVMIESNGKYLFIWVVLKKVSVFRHIVTSKDEYVNIMAEAAPLVIVTPYPAILLSPECSLSTE